MRKIILITAMVLASASAQAGGSRSLSLAPVNGPTPAQQVAPTAPAAAGNVKVSEAAPMATAKLSAAPATNAAKPAAKTMRTSRSRHKNSWTAGRIISELHRHGIYW